MRIAAMMRVKNEARWVEESIRSIKPLCSRIYVLDDHSTDETPQIVESLVKLNPYAVKLCDSPFDGEDESRDKNFLLGWLLKTCKPPVDWVLCIDGDEVLEKAGPDKIVAAITSNRMAQALSLRVGYLWGNAETMRVDGVYGNFQRSSLFKVAGLDHGFSSRGQGTANRHCGNAPHGLTTAFSFANLKHYGYMLPEDRERKRIMYGNGLYPNPGGEPKLLLYPRHG